MADDDELDDFFNEVEEAEEEAKTQEQQSAKSENFERKKEDHKEELSPPLKKLKTTGPVAPIAAAAAAAATVTPIINVAATHTDVVSHAGPLSNQHSVLSSAPPPPPPPPLPPGPPPQHSNIHLNNLNHKSSRNSGYSNYNSTGLQPPLPPPLPPGGPHQSKIIQRTAAGTTWIDPTLAEFPPNDFRLFVGNLAKDTPLNQLEQFFKKDYPSFAMAKICYNKHDGKSKGYGFVSMLDPMDAARAVREKDQKWLGSRPIKVRMSDWKDRDARTVQKKVKKNLKRGKKRLW